MKKADFRNLVGASTCDKIRSDLLSSNSQYFTSTNKNLLLRINKTWLMKNSVKFSASNLVPQALFANEVSKNSR